jgi:prolyl-tRNA editing enzyme YbaK/EbsC (Cys-tRNA(Pro) deacylase)
VEYHKVTNKIVGILTEAGLWFETFEHEPVRTSEEAAKIRTGYTLNQGAKTIIIRVKADGKRYFVMLVIPGDKKFDSEKVKDLLGSRDIRFATEEEVDEVTGGVRPGGVPPFGNIFDLKVIADHKLFGNEKIIFNAGDKRFSVAMKSADYRDLVKPEIESIIE